MESVVGPLKGASDGGSVERSGGPGLLLAPWTRHLLAALWEQLRLLGQIIYYSFLAVFQMFRLEVHLRITDETGRHVQRMSAAGNAAESFILSSLFESGGGGGGAIAGPLESRTGTLFSSLGGDDLCCSLVDDFVLRAAECLSEGGDAICSRRHSGWTSRDGGSWDVVAPEEAEVIADGGREGDADQKVPGHQSPADLDSFWDDDHDDGEGFVGEDSKALWESFTKSSDPYNPLNFSACLSSCSGKELGKDRSLDAGGAAAEAGSEGGPAETPCCPEGESDWEGSDDSDSEENVENNRLWELFSHPADPYNPLNFTACVSSCGSGGAPTSWGQESQDLTNGAADLDADNGDAGGADYEELWNSLPQSSDPYHPLCFRACLRSSPSHRDAADPVTQAQGSGSGMRSKPCLPKRHFKHHCPLWSQNSEHIVPWRKKKPDHRSAAKLHEDRQPALKKVRFSPVVQVHVMRSWSFARQASRKGMWEEMARDRERFRKRIAETEQAIGYCLLASHREKVAARLCVVEVPSCSTELD